MTLLRECVKEMLVESNVLATGMCFPFAYQKAEEWFNDHFTKAKPGRGPKRHPNLNDKSKFKVVHGTVTDKWKKPPKPVVHGWVEMGDLVFDDQTRITKPNGIEKEFYYDMYQPEVYKEFTAEEAILNCAMKGGEGPWDDDLYVMMQDRDAWMNEALLREATAIREPLNLSVPEDLKDIHRRMQQAGKELYVVGGAVRDALMGKTPKDYDVATNATPDQVIRILQSHGRLRLDLTGKAFGVVRVKTPDKNEYEIATFREDIGPGRRPEGVAFTSIEGDVKRRDLTVNALFYDMNTGEVVDYVGGIKDIEDGVIRAVGDPAQRFDEDRLRILRTIRFAGRMGAELDPATKAAILKDNSLTDVSPERIREEFLNGVSSAANLDHFINLITELGLFEQIFPGLQITPLSGTASNPYVQVAALLGDNASQDTQQVLEEMRYSRKQIILINFLIRLKSITKETAPQLKKDFIRHKISINDIEDFAAVTPQLSDRVVQGFLKFVSNPPASNPQELMAQGLAGEAIGQAMKAAEVDAYSSLVGELRSYIRELL